MSLEQIGRVLALPPDAISAPARAVLFVLAWYADADGSRAWPSVATLARQTSLSRRAVQMALSDLRSAGLASIIQPAVGQVPAVYRLDLTRASDAPLPAQDVHPRTTDTRAPDAQGGRTTRADPRTTRADPRTTCTQSVMNRHDHQNAGARDAVNGAHPRMSSTSAGPAPPANLTDNAPRFGPAPAADGAAKVLAELAERKRLRTAKPTDPSDHTEPDARVIPH